MLSTFTGCGQVTSYLIHCPINFEHKHEISKEFEIDQS